MFGALSLSTRPVAGGPRVPRAFRVAAVVGEYGFAAWSYSRQAKLNAWTWHGIGALGNVNSWATLGNVVYLRNDTDDLMYAIQPDVFLAESDTNTESTSCECTSQWLDFGHPGKMKALDAMDLDVLGVTSIEIYVYIPDPDNPRVRTGTLASTITLASEESGWTYSGEQIPLGEVGSATEFQLRLIGDPNQEVQINRLTLYWSDVAG